jgi:hypothetical protein
MDAVSLVTCEPSEEIQRTSIKGPDETIFTMIADSDATYSCSGTCEHHVPVRTDELRTDELRTDELRTDELRTDELRTDELRTDELRTDELRTDELRTDELRTDELRTDELRTDELRTDELRTDELRTDELRTVVRCAYDGHEMVGNTYFLLPEYLLHKNIVQGCDTNVQDMKYSDINVPSMVFCSSSCRKAYFVERMFQCPHMLHIHTMLFGIVKSAPDALSLSVYHKNDSDQTDLMSIQEFRSTCDTLNRKHDAYAGRASSYFCAHDRHPFSGVPCFIPLQFMHSTDTFRLCSLTFCSPQCRLGYLTYDVNTRAEQYTLLHQYDTQRGVKVALPSYYIRSFWNHPPTQFGTLSIDDFRK